MKQLSCKREQKRFIRSLRQINSPAGGCPSHARTNTSPLPLIGLSRLELALAQPCRMFHAVEVALQQSGGKSELARVGLNERPLKGMNLSSPRAQERGFEREVKGGQVEIANRRCGNKHQSPALTELHQEAAAQKAAPMQEPYRFHANEQGSLVKAIHTSQGLLAHGELRHVEGTDRDYEIGTSCEWFRFQNVAIGEMKRSLQRLLDHIKPDIIHLQHYSHFGIYVIRLLQTISPKSKIVLTLHDHLALCMHNGQMVTTGKLKLCHKTTPFACSLCFPEHTPQEMFLRSHFIRTIFESCDGLVGLSQFFINRHSAFGISHPNFAMIENGIPEAVDVANGNSFLNSHSAQFNWFGYFGQLNRYKGILVLLRAAFLPQEEGIKNFTININGANLEYQPQDFQDEFNVLFEMKNDRIFMRGSYRQQDIESLMLENDWLIMPSISRENSPVVLQEAMFYDRPIIKSGIGGIAEKLIGRGGVPFTATSESSLAAQIKETSGNKLLHHSLIGQFHNPTTASQCADQHHRMYNKLISSKSY